MPPLFHMHWMRNTIQLATSLLGGSLSGVSHPLTGDLLETRFATSSDRLSTDRTGHRDRTAHTSPTAESPRNVFKPADPGTRVYGRGDASFRWEDQDDEIDAPGRSRRGARWVLFRASWGEAQRWKRGGVKGTSRG